MKRITKYISLTLTVSALFFSCGCQSAPQPSAELPAVQPRKIIIDTDTGADDASAIILAALQPEIDILGLTVVAGNVTLEQGARNALMALETAGRTDIPVYCGAEGSIAGIKYDIFSVFGTDGMGDAGLIHPSQTPEDGNAVDFILNTIASSPDEVEIVALGPATNIALAVQKDPDTMEKVKHIWVMGTSGFGPGNATPVAEFNTFTDPEAFQILADSGLPITVVGLDSIDACTYISREEQENLLNGNDLEKFIGASLGGLMDFNRENIGQDIADLPDPIAMACVIWDDYMTEAVPCHASTIVIPGETYGQVLFYKEGHGYNIPFSFENYNVRVATETRSDLFKDWFFRTIREYQP